jgi:TonB-linked SusC/RagA family outer membrane protein
MKNSIFIFACIVICNFNLLGQNQKITGIIKDKKTNEPLFGATILLKGTNSAMTSDLNGRFQFNFNAKENIKYALKISYIGYKTSVISITTEKYYEIVLSEALYLLDEIIITSSYGTKKLREEVVGSITTIKPDHIIKEQAAVSFEELLEGQVAGLNIEINPELGEAVSIDIRGKGSLQPLNQNVIGTSTQPLIIIDGIIMSEEVGIEGSDFFDVGTGSLSENMLNPLAKIGVQDIESISVLKDAAAVGIYGADAANGVLIITTKSGKKGKLTFNASVQSGLSTAINQLKYLTGKAYQNVVNRFNSNSGTPENSQNWNGVNTNWFNLLNTVGTFNRYNVGASGGKTNWTYRFNVGFQKNNESQIRNDFQKINTTFSLDYRNDKINFSLRLSPSLITKNNPNTLYSFALPPTIAPIDKNGAYTFFASYGNPLAVANQNKAHSETFGLLNSMRLSYKINQKLKLSSLFGMDFSYKNEDKFFSGLNGSGQFNDGSFGRRVVRERNSRRWNWNASASYNTQFKNHAIDIITGVELRGQKTSLTYNKGDGFSNLTSPQAINSALKQNFRADSSENYGVSAFTQANYNFDKKYFFLANFRLDKSSAFGGDNDTALNGGFGASWNLSNEAFLSKNKFIDFLRLRVSYGSTGNSRIGSYRALGLYTLKNNGYNLNNYANLTSLPNPNLGWEKNNKFNLGIDFNFLEKYQLTAEIFRDNIKDIIVSRAIIPEAGLNSAQINGAEMYNQGLELSLNTQLVNTNTFQWNTNFVFTKIQNKVTHLSGLGSQFSSAEVARAQRIGFATSTIWGFDFVGIDTATGNELYRVENQLYDAATLGANFDQTHWKPIGDSQPDFFGGVNNRISYRNFSLNVILSYTYGADMLLQGTLLDNYNALTNRNLSTNIFEDTWQQQGEIANYQAITKNREIISNSSKYIFDTTHIKLKSINIRYQIPTDPINFSIQKLSLFINGSNLMYWFKSGSPKGKNGVAEYRNTYPEMRTISMGINATF